MNHDIHQIKTNINFDIPRSPLRSVQTANEYFNLHPSDREVRHWLWHKKYLMPYALKMNDGELTNDLPMFSEWRKFKSIIKKKYPIQSFFRETVYDFLHFEWYKIRERYWSVKRYIFPRHRWLTKQIPTDWQDKRTLIVDILYMMVVHYIEGEKALENVALDDTEEHIKFQQGLIDCYKWIKSGRNELQIRIDNELTTASNSKIRDYHERYGKFDALETQMTETDTEFCNWIVNNREFLWV